MQFRLFAVLGAREKGYESLVTFHLKLQFKGDNSWASLIFIVPIVLNGWRIEKKYKRAIGTNSTHNKSAVRRKPFRTQLAF